LYGIVSVYLRHSQYVRPSGYFVSIVVLVVLLCWEAIWASSGRRKTSLLLLKTVLLGLSIEWSQQWIFPSVVGLDPWWHQWFTNQILTTGHIPQGNTYSGLPFLHLFAGSTMLTTGLSYKMAVMLSLSFVHVVIFTLVVFLLCRKLCGVRVGLLSSVLLVVADQNVRFGIFSIPNTYAYIAALLMVYFLLKTKSGGAGTNKLIVMILMVAILFSHSLTSAWVVALLIILWLGFRGYSSLYHAISKIPFSASLGILYLVSMLLWWMFVSGYYLEAFVGMVRGGFGREVVMGFSLPSEEILQNRLHIGVVEQLFRWMGFLLLLGTSFIGYFFMISSNFKSGHLFAYSAIGLFPIALGFFGFLTGTAGLEDRLFFFAMPFSSIAAAVALVIASEILRNGPKRRMVSVAAVAMIAFLMLMSPSACFDNRTFSPSTSVRLAATENELQSISAIRELFTGSIGTDAYATLIVRYSGTILNQSSIPCQSISANLVDRNFTGLNDTLLIIREEIVHHTFEEVINLDYDPRDVLGGLGFSEVFDSGSVVAFIRP
jgi:hypothetical protein